MGEFFGGFLTGAFVLAVVAVGFKFYHRTEAKDAAVADSLGKTFEEKIRLVPKEGK